MGNTTMETNNARNQRVAAVIYILAFLAIHALAYFIPAQPHFVGWRIPLFAIAALSVLILAFMFWKNSDITEDFGWPEGVVIVLSFASAVCIGWIGDSFNS